ncbi:MAG: hypothetical protein RIT81_03060 [Deltaproteobacteria bacterium]
MSKWSHAPILGVFMLLLAGCPGFGSAPEPIEVAPSWDNEIEGILAQRCAYCHTNPPENFAPSGFRLDKYTVADLDDGGLDGVLEKLDRIQARAVDASTMPPSSVTPLTPEEKAILGAWIAAGAPRTTEAAQ